MHDRRRRIRDIVTSAFQVRFSSDTVKPILTLFPWTASKEDESRLNEYAQLLEQRIARANGHHINVSRLCYQYSFDVMGRLSFGKSFNMLTEDKNHFAIDLLQMA
jgi:hypothetical protein